MTRRILQAGARLGRYEIRSILGAGAMADVYLAVDLLMDREVALKVLAPGPGASERLRRFEREARSVTSARHRNIVAIFEVGSHDGTPFIAMEYVSGETLQEKLRNGPLSPAAAVDVGAQLADGLQAAHEAGIIEGKPAGLPVFEKNAPPALRAVVERLLAKRPEERYPSMRRSRRRSGVCDFGRPGGSPRASGSRVSCARSKRSQAHGSAES